ncbi:ATP-dependent protease La (LON) domain protein [Zea mays]|uniref:ATP-dependent protease La (LON) domain protein n=1 Tax=Zea mays TaxID=4577 RepID=A0A1D6PSI5_MAIZE|nr:ATP-dependent protease La (LON) domain protein [Zea mays]
MAASAPIHLLLSPSRSTWPPQDPSLRPIPPLHAWPARQRHLRAARCALSPPTPSLDLPLLPFQPAEVLIPSESKTLHLYEARYIALLEEALYKREKSFVHFVLDPVVDSSTKASFAVPEDEPLQTNIRASLLWSEKESFEEYNESFIPGRPERLSFAAYQTVSGMSDELLTVQNYKIQAMDSTDTLERLNTGIKFVEHNIGMIAARLAIQNI